MMNNKQYVQISLAFVLSTQLMNSAYSDSNCNGSIEDCIKSTFTSEVQDFIPDQINSSKIDLLNKITGLNGLDSIADGLTKNFLPLFDLGGIISSSGDEDSDGEYVIDFNQALGKKDNKDNNFQIKAVIDTKANLSESLKAAIPMAIRDTTASSLESEIGGADNISISLSYNHVTPSFGRNMSAYVEEFSPLAHSVLDKSNIQDIQALQTGIIFGKFIKQVQEELDLPSGFSLDSDMSIFKDRQEEAEALLKNVVLQHDISLNALSTAANQYMLSNFSDLVNNQPQLHLEVTSNIRDELVGSDELSIKLTYEKGFYNLNTYKNKCNQGVAGVECFRDYMIKHADQLKSSDRLAFSLEYTDIDGYDLNFPDAGFTFNQPATEKLIGSIGYGRTIITDKPENHTRLEVMLDFETFLGNSEGNDRFVASAVATRKFGNFSVPFGIVYANKSEFLDESDSQLSAHIAIKFDVNRL